MEVCKDKFHQYDYSKFNAGTYFERAKTIRGTVDFIVGDKITEEMLKVAEESKIYG